MACEMSLELCQPVEPALEFVKDVKLAKCESVPTSGRSRIGQFNLTFNHLKYKVRTGFGLPHKREWKCILKGVSGEFLSGELTGIIGPSGCGKSTLMDILTGYTISNKEGEVLFNGVKDGLARYDVCYIMQDTQLQPLFTVKEAINFAANLKLSSDVSYKEKKLKIMNCLESLSLMSCQNTIVEKISGGEKKRLAIALELITNPPVLFIDEPTSGLDSSSSKQCLEVLKLVADKGRIVVCSIHQPSALLFEMFDHLYTMAAGECIYQGSVENLLPYLASLGFICPSYYNPADYVLEISLLERQECHNELVRASGNGTCCDWRQKRISSKTSSQNLGTCSASVYKEEFEINDSMNGIKSFGVIHRKQCCTNIFKQSFILLHRNAIRLYREKTLIRARLIFHIVIGFLIGLLYHGIGSDAAFVFDNFSFIFFCLMFLMFTSFSAMIMAFPSELTIVIREYFNCWYSLKSYYFSVVMADIIFQIICTTTYCSLVYMITSQPRDIQRFILFTLMYILVSLVSQGIGLFVGASMRIEHGMVFGALFIAPWVIFSGFFLHLSDAAPWFHWIFHISFLKHGLEGVMEALYGYNRPRLSCSIDYCHFISPKKLLKEFDLLHNDYWTNFYILFSYIVVIYIITYFMLKYQVYHKR
ncbi:ATP-binding cassette sub-family G member 1-like [Lycorma delicatula]|uniref:ATP-binding cassette sub-family G member 1-like n=1 Tax=Lycorma delicatula TaxID=130591 RepID=UPI003F50F744